MESKIYTYANGAIAYKASFQDLAVAPREAQDVPDELNNHFFSSAYSRARILPVCPTKLVLYKNVDLSQTCTVEFVGRCCADAKSILTVIFKH